MYYSTYNNQGERLWLPIIAGAAILAAPFWLNRQNNTCCNNNYQQPYPYYPYPQPYPQPVMQPVPQPYPYPYPYPYPEPVPYPVFSPTV